MSRESDQARRFVTGDRVRIDIPNEAHPDHSRYHGRHGRVIALIPADGDRHGQRYRVDFDTGGYDDFPPWFLRPPIAV